LARVRDGFKDYSTLTLDLDSHVETVYGNQQRARKGYNPKKPGRKSFHPILCFIGETRDFLWGKFRSGNVYTSEGAIGFLKGCVKRLPGEKKDIFLRADSGFFGDKFLRVAERREIKYAVAAKLYKPIQMRLGGVSYRDIGKGVEVGEFHYQGHRWKRARRMVVIREEIAEGEAKKKRPKLFDLKGHSYQVIVSNFEEWSSEEVWRFYNKRACVENMIKEGMMGYGLDVAVSHSYGANAAHFFLVMLAYNLMNWFKEDVLGQRKVKRMAKWVRERFFYIPGKLIKRGRKRVLNLWRDYPWQEEYHRAEERLQELAFP
jgi:Transposase DDE domain.